MKRQYVAASTNYNTREKHIPAPIFRREFFCENTSISTAKIEIAVVGFYRLFLNGKEITKGVMAPYISNPNDIVYYDEYDVSGDLQDKNVICILLGNGFSNSMDGGVWDFENASFRAAPKVHLLLTVNGEQVLTTDENFEVYSSAITFDDYRCGERYDARLANPEIFRFGYRNSFSKPIMVSEPKGEYKKCEAQPIKEFQRFKAKKIFPVEGGYIYDFAENNAGVCRLKIKAKLGQKISLTHGEVIKNGRLDITNISFDRNRFDGYVQHDEYICKEGEQEWQPCFTYHAFRFVYVEGITPEQATEDLLEYVVLHSDLPQCGKFVCSDELINKIQECILRSDLSNFYYFPTDCPQREKNGWTADASLSTEQFLYNFDCVSSLREWLNNIRKAQNTEGALPGIVPTDGWGFAWGNGPAWDSVLVEIPYRLYQFTGDKEILRENADAICRYFSYLQTRINENGLIAIGLGDWCEIRPDPDKQYRTPLEVTDTLTCVDLSRKAEFILREIGKGASAEEIALFGKKLAETFIAKYIDNDMVSCNTQTGQAMALKLGLFGNEEQALKHLLSIIKEDGCMRVGVIGARYIFDVLAEHGEAELAYRLIRGPEFASYGYWITHDMTTLGENFIEFTTPSAMIEFERKDGNIYVDSLNHHFWGCVSAWFYKYIAGLNLLSQNTVEICPQFVSELHYARAEFKNERGYVTTDWRREGGKIELTVISEGFRIVENFGKLNVIEKKTRKNEISFVLSAT